MASASLLGGKFPPTHVIRPQYTTFVASWLPRYMFGCCISCSTVSPVIMPCPRSPCCSYSKGAVLVLVWIGLLRACNPLVAKSIHPGQVNKVLKQTVHLICLLAFYLVLPLAGLLADVRFSRYKFALFSSVLSLAASVIVVFEILLDSTFEFSKSCSICDGIVNVFSYFDDPLNQVAITCFLLSAILFGLDQSESASTEVLSSYVWWYYWVAQLDGLINSIAGCSSSYIPHAALLINCIHISCMLVIIVSSCACKRWLIIFKRTNNPLLLIARVLNYARKTKYPENRSALTYWQNNYPPRIDFGKNKYGGPFTEEQVENVKTFLRLLPLLFCTQMVFIPALPLGRFHQTINNTQQDFGECLLGSTYMINFCIALLIIPWKITFLGNYCRRYKCFSTLLRQIGIGIILSITGKAILTGFDFYAKVSNNNTFCLFSDTANITENDVVSFPIDYRLLLIPNVVNGLGALLIIPTSLEFIVAQAPLEMRGLYLGMMFTTRGIYEELGWYLIKPFKQSPWLWPSCEFYLLLLNTLIMAACLVLFVPLGYWYKLRTRDDVFNPHIIAEEYYEKDFINHQKYGAIAKRQSELQIT